MKKSDIWMLLLFAFQSMTEKQAKELREQREGERLLRDLNDRSVPWAFLL